MADKQVNKKARKRKDVRLFCVFTLLLTSLKLANREYILL